MEIIINPHHNPVFMYIFNYPIRYYGIILSFAIFTGIFLAQYFVKTKTDMKTFYYFERSIPLTVALGLIGARLFYVLGSLDYFSQNPKEIFMINHGGISIWGAIFFGIIGIYLYTKSKKISFLKYADFWSLVLPLCQAIGRFGNYFNQEAFGRPAQGFIKLYVDKPYRPQNFTDIEFFEPAFLYESILDICAFMVLLYLFKKFNNLKSGTIFFSYLTIYSIIRLAIESIRIDSILNVSGFPVASLISIIAVIFGITGLLLIHCKSFNH